MKSGMNSYNVEEAASKIMKEFDTSGDDLLSEDEFVAGVSKWLHITDNHNPNSKKREDHQHNFEVSENYVILLDFELFLTTLYEEKKDQIVKLNYKIRLKLLLFSIPHPTKLNSLISILILCCFQ